MTTDRARRLSLAAIGGLAFVAAWELVGRLGWFGLSFPPLTDVLPTVSDQADLLARSAASTVGRAAIGYVGGVATSFVVAIARALALDPDVLLLDEPFGALDAVTRRQLNLELQGLWSLGGITTLLVTHSVEEAILLADRVAVISPRPGRVLLERDVVFDRPRPREIEHTDAFRDLVDELTGALDSAITKRPTTRE